MHFAKPRTLLLGSAACLSLIGYRCYRVRITPLLTLVKLVATVIRLKRLFSRNTETLSCEAAALYWIWSFSKSKIKRMQTIHNFRKLMLRFAYPLDPWMEVSSEVIEGYDGKPSVQCYWYGHSEVKSSKIILYFHGGGYVMGDATPHGRVVSSFSRALGIKVLLPEYRLCPENAYPAPVEDCLSVYMHLIEISGRSPRDIIFMGESAGGALVASVMLALRARALPLPAAGVMLSPFTNLKFDYDSLDRNWKTDKICSRGKLLPIRDVLMKTCGLREDDPLLSPEFADLRGLPPLFVQAGTHEILEDCATLFAKKALAAGVTCELSLVECGLHGGELQAEFTPEGREQFNRVCKFVENVKRNYDFARRVEKQILSKM
eukprot:24558_1